MKNKAKGSKAERELVSMLWGSNMSAVRVAGSGTSRFPCPDIIASNGNKVLAIECKSTKNDKKYFNPEQIRQLKDFSEMFGAQPLLAIKFSSNWLFFNIDDLRETKKGLVINKEHKNAKFFLDV